MSAFSDSTHAFVREGPDGTPQPVGPANALRLAMAYDRYVALRRPSATLDEKREVHIFDGPLGNLRPSLQIL